MRFSQHRRAFTIVELLVAIVVFALGLVAAYSLLRTATFLSMRSRDEIVGGNLLRERLELLKNVRDSNWVSLRSWDSLKAGVAVTSDDPSFCSVPDDCRLTPGAYLVENDFSSTVHPVKIRRLASVPTKDDVIAEANSSVLPKLRLCLDSSRRYVHDCASPNTKTPYYAYVVVSPLVAEDASGTPVTVSGALSVSAKFVSVDSGYRELSMESVLTDWKR